MIFLILNSAVVSFFGGRPLFGLGSKLLSSSSSTVDPRLGADRRRLVFRLEESSSSSSGSSSSSSSAAESSSGSCEPDSAGDGGGIGPRSGN